MSVFPKQTLLRPINTICFFSFPINTICFFSFIQSQIEGFGVYPNPAAVGLRGNPRVMGWVEPNTETPSHETKKNTNLKGLAAKSKAEAIG